MKKVFIGVGHGGKDSGAASYFEPDLAIDVHSNSGRGDGFEA